MPEVPTGFGLRFVRVTSPLLALTVCLSLFATPSQDPRGRWTVAGILASFLLGIFLPVALLPWSSVDSSQVRERALEARTVFAVTVRHLDHLTWVRGVHVHGRGGPYRLLLLGFGWRFLLLTTGGPGTVPRSLRSAATALADRSPRAVGREARAQLGMPSRPRWRLEAGRIVATFAMLWMFLLAGLVGTGLYALLLDQVS